MRKRSGLGLNRNRKLIAFSLFASCLVFAFPAVHHIRFSNAEANAVQLPPMSLTVVGANGTEIVLNETGIAALLSYSGYGEYKTQFPSLKGFGNYTGVALETLCNLVGGLTNTSILNITAADSYSINFTYAQIKGDFVTYNNATGAEMNHTQPLVPIIAYYLNGTEISSPDGPLRLAIISAEGFATNSGYWVKQVVRIEIIETAVPEFPYAVFLPFFFLITLAAVLSLKVRARR
jgi:hypothetical protein